MIGSIEGMILVLTRKNKDILGDQPVGMLLCPLKVPHDVA
jgi:hypothetical protein